MYIAYPIISNIIVCAILKEIKILELNYLQMKNVSLLICSALLVFGFLNKSHAQTEIITTYAGTGTASYTGDGGQCATATLSGPAMLNTDGSGNIYIYATIQITVYAK